MTKKLMVCKECKYWFPIQFTHEDMTIFCPYCKKQGTFSEFEDTERTDYGTGYRRSLKEFKNVLIHATKENLNFFFQNTVKVYSFEKKNEKFFFSDSKGNEVTIREVHKTIQSDIVMQRDLYNMWMDLYH